MLIINYIFYSIKTPTLTRSNKGNE